ncbi:nuclear transport factor 2 family protein [Sphingomonas colocasiae]|uniref:Nuclear transport factor 2 family protein n=1 Tax=Sphingomonas colocasiae TaxID=1848973 RepID=A0ABS7PPH7_9SPHN|nr:nuclear transport factor 2 family protein [Sphingomonas colocasiae]MBY8821939.1 nuclear transport factor 2 family protein [Sphingomonas colocasiae]
MLAHLKSRTRRIYDAALGVGATALALFALRPTALAQTPTETEKRNRHAVQSSFDAWRAGTGSPFDLLADDARWTIEGHSVASRTYPSKADFMREVIRPFNARMQSPLRPSVRNLYADGNTVVAFFDARGTALDGKPYVNTYAWFLDMRNGRIIKASAFFDAIEFNELWARVAPAPAN